MPLQAVSFDVWLTLIRSHPEFKAARAALFHGILTPDASLDDFAQALRASDRVADRESEETGDDVGLGRRVSGALGLLHDGAAEVLDDLPDDLVATLTARQHDLACTLPPRPLHPDVPRLLSELAEYVPLAITSNTGMLPGSTMRELLDLAGVYAPFSVGTFSNEVGRAKPAPEIFTQTVADLGVPAAGIVHVGDNPRADVDGATLAGMRTEHVNQGRPIETIIADLIREAASDVSVAPGAAGTPDVLRVTAHTLTVADPRGGLDLADYSAMKHGGTTATQQLAGSVARVLAESVPELTTDPVPPVFPVAYLAVRPACWYLADEVLRGINAERAARGLSLGRIVRVHKDSVTRTDYATASAEARRAELASIRFTLTEDVTGSRLVVVDDVRVTGLAESAILGALQGSGAQQIVLAYLATVEGDLAADPSIEARLNTAAAESLDDLAQLASTGGLALTIRMLKRVLGASADERRAFLDACPTDYLDAALEGALATGQEFCDGYARGMRDLVVERTSRDGSANESATSGVAQAIA